MVSSLFLAKTAALHILRTLWTLTIFVGVKCAALVKCLQAVGQRCRLKLQSAKSSALIVTGKEHINGR